MKIALVHDYLRTFGGGERVLLALHRIWPDAQIYVATADYQRIGPKREELKDLNIKTSWAQYFFPFVKKPLLYRPFIPLVWKSINVGEVDVVITSSGANISKGVRVPKNALHICYCHTTPRYLYGLTTESDFLLKIPIFGGLVKLINKYLLKYDQKTSKTVDYFVANSENVRNRIKDAYNLDSVVVHPPVNIKNNSNSHISHLTSHISDYYLVVSRLVPYKNIDLIVKAFNDLNLPLYIVGAGIERKRLEGIANSNVKFFGEVSDSQLVDMYQHSKAFVVATTDEDFGITPIEAQSYGKPVIAYKSGGLQETVIEGKTGIFFEKLTIESLTDAVARFEKMKFEADNCIENAKKFSEEVFSEKMKDIMENGLKQKRGGKK